MSSFRSPFYLLIQNSTTMKVFTTTALLLFLATTSCCLIATCAFAPRNSFSQRSQACLNPSLASSSSSDSTSTSTTMPTPVWYQHEISLTAPSRGCHLVTSDILKTIGSDVSKIQIGMCNLFIQHTSASLTVNENADPDVRRDMETALNKLVPAEWNRDGTFRHTTEGDDDMPGHVKSSLMGASLDIPIRKGRLALGTWQGIYLNEHRDQGGYGGGHTRNIIVTLQGVQGK
jgi:secondary thiamine-phosphate synthase enzyme